MSNRIGKTCLALVALALSSAAMGGGTSSGGAGEMPMLTRLTSPGMPADPSADFLTKECVVTSGRVLIRTFDLLTHRTTSHEAPLTTDPALVADLISVAAAEPAEFEMGPTDVPSVEYWAHVGPGDADRVALKSTGQWIGERRSPEARKLIRLTDELCGN